MVTRELADARGGGGDAARVRTARRRRSRRQSGDEILRVLRDGLREAADGARWTEGACRLLSATDGDDANGRAVALDLIAVL